jgi:hypothetical protein
MTDADILAKARAYAFEASPHAPSMIIQGYIAGYQAAMHDMAQSLAPALDVVKDGDV